MLGERMKIETSVPDDVFLEAEKLAKRLAISNSELFRQALLTFIQSKLQPETQETDPVREKLDVVYSQESSDVDVVLLGMQFASLPKEEW